MLFVCRLLLYIGEFEMTADTITAIKKALEGLRRPKSMSMYTTQNDMISDLMKERRLAVEALESLQRENEELKAFWPVNAATHIDGERDNIRAALESALSTDSELVAYLATHEEHGDQFFSAKNADKIARHYSANRWSFTPLYAAPPAPSVAVKAEDFARQLWGYFKGDSTGGTTAMQWFDNNKSLGGPAHLIELCRSALFAQVQDVAGWQDISTAPKNIGAYLFCRLAWGDGNDRCTGDGFRCNGRWFAVGTFYKGGRFDECQYEMRQIEVQPTHWMESHAAPAAKLEEKP